MSLRGYWRTLIVFIACKPAMRITKLTTSASTGRRIKRSVKDFMSILSGERTRLACWRWRRNEHAMARALPSSRDENQLLTAPSSLLTSTRFRHSTLVLRHSPSRIRWLRIYLWFRREIVVDRHRHAVAQFENPGPHYRFTRLQSRGDGDKIAARLAHAHKLLTDGLRFLIGLRVLLLLDHKNRVPERRVRHCASRNNERFMFL